jgi:hypothetical protein
MNTIVSVIAILATVYCIILHVSNFLDHIQVNEYQKYQTVSIVDKSH